MMTNFLPVALTAACSLALLMLIFRSQHPSLHDNSTDTIEKYNDWQDVNFDQTQSSDGYVYFTVATEAERKFRYNKFGGMVYIYYPQRLDWFPFFMDIDQRNEYILDGRRLSDQRIKNEDRQRLFVMSSYDGKLMLYETRYPSVGYRYLTTF